VINGCTRQINIQRMLMEPRIGWFKHGGNHTKHAEQKRLVNALLVSEQIFWCIPSQRRKMV